MSYRALYRVWRPQTFEDLVGQEHVTKTLTNALAEGHFSHAYLFSGPRGTGKTSAAKIMAKAINCVHGPAAEPCNECEACRKITDGSLMDVVEIDAASNRGVDEIRDLRDKVKYAPSEVRYKVYIIDEVHMLTTEAFNALLKTLEEPPGHVVFILATTEPHKLPPTIISRCQRFSFRRHTMGNLLFRLRKVCDAQGVEAGDAALAAIAQAADGGMRDALSLLDQVLAFSPERVDEEAVLAVTGSVSRRSLAQIMESVLSRDASGALDRVDHLLAGGVEAERLVQDLVHLSRDLLLLLAAPDLEEVRDRLAGDEAALRLSEQSDTRVLSGVLDVLIEVQQRMKWVPHPRILLEMTLVHLCRTAETGTPVSAQAAPATEGEGALVRLQEQVRRLEERVQELSRRPSPAIPPVPQSPAPQTPAGGAVASRPPPDAGPKGSRTGASAARIIGQNSPEFLKRAKQQWPEVLAKVKERKITVHAWLIDGEPVAAAEDGILLAFKNGIHRETTEKEVNKALIRQVMEELFGSPQELVTIMRADWERDQAGAETSAAREEPQTPASGGGDREPEEKDPVRRAMELFGEDLIEITD